MGVCRGVESIQRPWTPCYQFLISCKFRRLVGLIYDLLISPTSQSTGSLSDVAHAWLFGEIAKKGLCEVNTVGFGTKVSASLGE